MNWPAYKAPTCPPRREFNSEQNRHSPPSPHPPGAFSLVGEVDTDRKSPFEAICAVYSVMEVAQGHAVSGTPGVGRGLQKELITDDYTERQ